MSHGPSVVGRTVVVALATGLLLIAATAGAQVTTYSEEALRNQSKGWTLIALIALIGLLTILVLWLIFTMWRVSNQFGKIRRSLRELGEARERSRPVDPWVTAGQRMNDSADDEPDDDDTTDPQTRRGDDDGPDIGR